MPKNPFRITPDEVTATTAALHLTHRFSLPPDGWIHLAPIGDFPHEKGLQRITSEDIAAVAQSFNDEGRPALIDFEHESHDPAKRTTAAGWVEEVQARPDGLWGKMKPSRKGSEEIEAGHYRYLSPTLNSVRDAEGNWRPVALRDVGLTNQPNMRSLKPIAHRKGAAGEEAGNADAPLRPQGTGARETSPAPAKSAPLVPSPISMKNTLAALGLAENASDDVAAAAVASLKNSLRVQNEALVESDLERFKEHYKPEAREAVKAQFLANRSGAVALFESLSPPAAPAASNEKEKTGFDTKPLSHRQTAKTPGGAPLGDKESAATAAETARAAVISNRAVEISRTEKLPFSVAWNRALAESPALAA